MKASELRIGNYVSSVDGKMFKIEVGSDINSFWNRTPLTTEWLCRFGFKPLVKDWQIKGLILHSRKRGFVVKRKIPPILYVHQLQNLYFALTGEELTIKP